MYLLHFNSWLFFIIPSPTVCQNVTVIYNKNNTIDLKYDQHYPITKKVSDPFKK